MGKREERPGSARVLLALAVLALAPALVPPSEAHGEHGEEAPKEIKGGMYAPPPPTGSKILNKKPYFSYYDNTWLYGESSVTVLAGENLVNDIDVSGDWLVWHDAKKNDIYAFNVPAEEGFYVTKDRFLQYAPAISGNTIVWEDRRNGVSDVFAYFLDTGETRRITNGPPGAGHRNPTVHGHIVAWEDDRGEDWDIWAYNLVNRTEWRVSAKGPRDSDPVVFDRWIFWRAYRFNVWDVAYYDLETGVLGYASADRFMELLPFTNGKDALFMKEAEGGWNVWRFNPRKGVATNTGIILRDNMDPFASGDHLFQVNYDGARGSILANNLSNKYGTRVTGFLPVMSNPVSQGDTVYVPVWNGTRAAILIYDVNPAAFVRPPKLDIDGPEDMTAVAGPTRFYGTLLWEAGWNPPVRFGYTINGRNFTVVEPSPKWEFTLDLTRYRPGQYEIQLEAHFADSIPVLKAITIIVPDGVRGGLDVERAGTLFHELRVQAFYLRYFGTNPATWMIVALVGGLATLWYLRYRWAQKPRRRPVVEYVRQEGEEPPPGPGSPRAPAPPAPPSGSPGNLHGTRS